MNFGLIFMISKVEIAYIRLKLSSTWTAALYFYPHQVLNHSEHRLILQFESI